MKQTLAFSIIIILSGYICVNAQDLVTTGKVTDSTGSALSWVSIALKGDSIPSEVIAIAYNVKKERVLPVEIPNAYNGDNSIEIPNAGLINPNPIVKTTPIPKITSKFLPYPER